MPLDREIEVRVPQSRVVGIPEPEDLNNSFRFATAIFRGGLFPQLRSAEQVLTIIMIGESLGLAPMQALTSIYMVEGRPMMSANLLASIVQSRPELGYRVLEMDDEHCAIEFFRDGEPVGTSVFSQADANRAGLVRAKSGWEKFPRNMMFARAMSNGVKWYVPDATFGIPVYVDGEIEPRHVLDGATDGSANDVPATVSLAVVVEDIPFELRDRFYAAYGEAADLGSPPSLLAVQMTVKGQPRERVEEYIVALERGNVTARAAAQDEVTDAEVVPDDAGETDTSAVDPVESLRAQIAVLEARQIEIEENPGDFAETSLELDQIVSDIERLEGLIAAAEDAGQGSLL